MSAAQSPYPAAPNGHALNGNGASASYQPSEALSVNSATSANEQDGHASDNGYGVAGPSTGVNGYSHMQYVPSHNEVIVDHLYNAGFQHGEYADTILHVRQNMYRLHAIILSRSPYLAHLMSTSPKSGGMNTIYVPLDSIPEITDQGFAVALGYLYSSVSLNSLTPNNARAVLAAGCLLGGMDDLCAYAYQACKDSITVETINEWIDFVNSLPAPSDGINSPTDMQRTIFGPYQEQLRNDVFHFLVVTLPTILDVHQVQPSAQTAASQGRETLLQIFSRVPFDLFKNAIESPTFQIGADKERFKFAKEAIELRKRTRQNGGAVETVVLAFGGNSPGGSAVHVTRKTRKRQLFKVG